LLWNNDGRTTTLEQPRGNIYYKYAGTTTPEHSHKLRGNSLTRTPTLEQRAPEHPLWNSEKKRAGTAKIVVVPLSIIAVPARFLWLNPGWLD